MPVSFVAALHKYGNDGYFNIYHKGKFIGCCLFCLFVFLTNPGAESPTHNAAGTLLLRDHLHLLPSPRHLRLLALSPDPAWSDGTGAATSVLFPFLNLSLGREGEKGGSGGVGK